MGLKLRTDLDIQPFYYEGEKALLITDHLGLLKNPLLLRGAGLEILSLIDGRREERDIQLEFLRRQGYQLGGAELVREILDQFKKLGLLDDEDFRRKKKALVEEFSKCSERKAALAGEAYPAEADKLRRFLAEILSLTSLTREEKRQASRRSLRALVAPHIDLRSGQRLYSLAYQALEEKNYRRVVVLGTGHQLETGLLSISEKDFSTPLGLVRNDREVSAGLKKAAGQLAEPDDFAHRREHSIEFQLLFLQYLLGNEFQLVPILCSSLYAYHKVARRPAEIPGLRPFLAELKNLAVEEKTLFVTGVDLSHVGLKFGHCRTASQMKEETVSFDHDLIEAMLHAEPEKFWRYARPAGETYNVCGYSALALLLEIFSQRQVVFLGYDLVEEKATASAVSFAALAIY
ncbi:MAG: AmmeMemoRadiSam system protein B [Candidatus Aminicenantes bacterium]|nr:AmmeMemoRadiSam system protein B [Candidatus Aminicenantes bacterium]